MRSFVLASFGVLLALAGCSKEESDKGPPPLTVTIDTPASDVKIHPANSVDFTGSVADGTAPYTYLWTFSGAAPDSTLQDPGPVAFNSVGEYVVTFTVTDSTGRTGSDSVLVSVKVVIATIASPSSDVTIYKGQTVNFQGTPSGPVTTHTWVFQGGTPGSASVEDPGNVTYNTVGTFTASYTVSDGSGNYDTDTVGVTVLKTLVSIDIQPATYDLIQGQSVDYTVTATFSDDPPQDVTSACTFTSSDTSKVTMSGNRATAVVGAAPGTVTITASYTWDTTKTDTATINTYPAGAPYTKQQVKDQYNRLKPVSTTVSYSSAAILSVDDLGYQGALTPQLVTDAVNWTNFYRWLAGLPANITNNSTNEVRCQKGAHVLTMLSYLHQSCPDPHNPPLPTGASSNYQLLIYTPGEQACGESNIFRGLFTGSDIANVPTPAECVDGWMDDFGNEGTLGHRRWILHPELKTTAFGEVWGYHTGDNITYYSVLMHVLDLTAPMPDFDFVAYPSEGFYPKQCFLDPADGNRTRWSFSANASKYDLDGSTTVTVVRQSDGQTLSTTCTVLLPGYGITPTISFNPGESNLNETYLVTVTNIRRLSDDQRISYSYWVNFFDVTQ